MKNDDELQYITFILGFDLLPEGIRKEIATEGSDIAYDFCKQIATKFVESKEYCDLKFSTYDALNNWVKDNSNGFIKNYLEYRNFYAGKEVYGDIEILEKGECGDYSYALTRKPFNHAGNFFQYQVLCGYKINGNGKLEWDHGLYFMNNLDAARECFNGKINLLEDMTYRSYITPNNTYIDFGESSEDSGYFYNYYDKDRVLVDGGILLSDEFLSEQEIIEHIINVLQYSLEKNGEKNLKFENLKRVDDFEENIDFGHDR